MAMISTEDYRFFMDGALDGMVDIITRLDDDLANRLPVLLGDGIRLFGHSGAPVNVEKAQHFPVRPLGESPLPCRSVTHAPQLVQRRSSSVTATTGFAVKPGQ